ncbi:hypothetical protein A9Q75_11305 [Colwellia psychrerythraea]|uniref:Uncharacterized protein n=1 Tax=Colwellia psychrerythraea TaxID=28229 RepID=A0A1Y5EBC8_COLPS|nr:hypothetical protein A9Q75_11305 [Colwellia psychrerythraea]
MKKSNQDVARENEKKLCAFFESDEPRPICHGRLNKTKLLESLGIGSSAKTNKITKPLLDAENIKIAESNSKTAHKRAAEGESSDRVKLMQSQIEQLTRKLALTESKLDEYRRSEIGESFLMRTGRMIQMRRVNPNQASIDFDEDK